MRHISESDAPSCHSFTFGPTRYRRLLSPLTHHLPHHIHFNLCYHLHLRLHFHIFFNIEQAVTSSSGSNRSYALAERQETDVTEFHHCSIHECAGGTGPGSGFLPQYFTTLSDGFRSLLCQAPTPTLDQVILYFNFLVACAAATTSPLVALTTSIVTGKYLTKVLLIIAASQIDNSSPLLTCRSPCRHLRLSRTH